MADSREKALQDYRKKLLEHKEVDGRLKECKTGVHVDVCLWRTSAVFVSGRDTLTDRQQQLASELASALSCS